MDTVQEQVGMAASNSVAYWTEVICGMQAPVQTHVIGDTPFSGRLAVERLGAVLLCRFRSTPVRYVRGQREIDRDPGDTFGASLTLTGRAIIAQDGKEVVQHPGDIVLFDTTRPFDYVLPSGDDQIVLDIPRALLQSCLPNADAFLCTVLSGGSKLGGLVGQMLRDVGTDGPRAGGAGGADAAVAARLGTTVVHLLATAFEVESESGKSVPPPPAGPRTLAKVQAFMRDRLSDPGLDIACIARENHVSVRALHRLFAAEGTTAMRWLWQQRLLAGYQALAAGRGQRVSEVALMCGFTNFSHFSRAFRQAFGMLPTDLLRPRVQRRATVSASAVPAA
ncbi:helix-turn-helix domain-containing protein (plasmid) [Ralstonia solanacearum]|nr:helix-turn-helix domain-containing protein [Ralstonia solanacearum]